MSVAWRSRGHLSLVLVAATAFSARQAVRAMREEAKARQAEDDAVAVQDFFRLKILSAARPKGKDGGLGRDVTLRAALDKAESSVATDFANRPKVEAAIRASLGKTYDDMGDLPSAIHQFERAVALRKVALGPDHPETLGSTDRLAVTFRHAGRPKMPCRSWNG